jgi:hypothetical protein
MIIHWANNKQWLHSFCYWDIWVFSFSFWFIFNSLCTNHYRPSSMVFFNPLDAGFLLLTTCTHRHEMCASHIDFSTIIALGQGLSFFPHIIINAPLSLIDCGRWQLFHFRSSFFIINCHFVAMSPFCIGLYLIFVDCLFLFFLWVMYICVFICVVLLMDGFPSLIFIYMVFISNQVKKKPYLCEFISSKITMKNKIWI